jgi:hypothetical protein
VTAVANTGIVATMRVRPSFRSPSTQTSKEKNRERFTLYGGRSNLIIYQVGRANLLKSFGDLD